ncbi:helicase-associated domain-containing protein [Actinomyces bowdenii]|uniref:Helicase XPB/Ssl2 N-terminal domain-containing protein n=1 Tax=Actinomyces bowdenii TaxID=131109 RepID=A0A3P1V4X0_9ACTO|nr:helicase-associated domain-containing protein [Actinomyces bowdenii]RRD29189.1 hypothetical protein EII10_07465 [Actinomyces bowdenii]
MSPVSPRDLAAHLTALPDHGIAALLGARPDLATPPPASLSALALRAAARPSVERALAVMDAPTLAVAQALVACEEAEEEAGEGPDVQAIATALGLPVDDAAAAARRVADLALVIGTRPVPGLVEAFGPHPFGLGPTAPQDPDPPPPALAELQSDPQGLPRASVELLEVLTWGPPVGTLRPGGAAPAAGPLIERGWLQRSADAQGRTRLLLPRQVALALRGGRLTREALTRPDPASLEQVDAATSVSEAAFHAEEAVRLVEELLQEWDREPAPILRTGGVGVRALHRTAEALHCEPAEAARIIETAAAAGLLGLDEAGAHWEPSRLAQDWRAQGLEQRWAPLAAAWMGSARTPWLVGARDDRGAPRPVLAADLEADWARRLRRRLLVLLGSLPPGRAATPSFVRSALSHERPRRTMPPGAVSAVMEEAGALGILGAGVLSTAGRVLARELAVVPEPASAAAPEAPGAPADHLLLPALEEALAADLPAPVAMLLVQSDLTAIVPGRPEPALARLLALTSEVESRGGALGVRFTPDSVRGALDAGWTAEELLEELTAFSPSPLPSALTALVRDASRRHGAVRVRAAASVLRVQDEAVAAGLLAEPALRSLGLSLLAPGVLVSSASPRQVVRELRRAGLAPAMEDAQGALLRLARPPSGRGAPAPARPGQDYAGLRAHRPQAPSARALGALVARMRQGEALRGPGAAEQVLDPAHVLAVLRQAQAAREPLVLRLAGPDGAAQERRVRVLAIEPGRVRLRDVARETELTVAVHRIISVTQDPAGAAGQAPA